MFGKICAGEMLVTGKYLGRENTTRDSKNTVVQDTLQEKVGGHVEKGE